AILRGNPGKRLINRSVERALHFRKGISGCGKSLTVGFSISGNCRRWMKEPNAGRCARRTVARL
ncbi:hypothetical protein OHC98_26755, partial [Escherichia coli]|nr:hypothetical protein [Escherichia coli]